jgi:thioredoxin reductase (NADPH)
VGGGPAGLSAAVALARMLRRVVVIDDRDGRSLWGQTNRNYLGFPEGIPAAEIRLSGRKQAARYGAQFIHGRVGAAIKDGERFCLALEPCGEPGDAAAGRPGNARRDLEVGASLGELELAEPVEVVARTVIIATGVRDRFPRFEGWLDCVGRSLFWCITCDGYETAGHVVAVVGHDEDSAQTALELLDFTPRVSIVAGREEGFDLPARRLSDFVQNGIAAYPHDVGEYRNRDGRIEALVLTDEARTVVPVEMVFTYRRPLARTEIAKALAVELDEVGQIVVDRNQHTNVAGVYAAGDVTSPHDHQVSAAVHEGNEAASAANYFLYRPVQRAFGVTEP